MVDDISLIKQTKGNNKNIVNKKIQYEIKNKLLSESLENFNVPSTLGKMLPPATSETF